MPSAAGAAAALLSLSDRRGLDALARALRRRGYRIVASTGTAAAVRELGIDCDDVSDVTGFPSLADGRVKTVHPKVLAGILARRSNPVHMAELAEHGIPPFSVVAVTLYPFEERAAQGNLSEQEAVDEIDVGGFTLMRAAAKNYESVSVLIDPAQYDEFAAALEEGGPTLEQRRRWAAAAFARCTRYDEAIARHFAAQTGAPELLPDPLRLEMPRRMPLRYGENPWARAAFYSLGGTRFPEQIAGKALSYNNLLDVDSCLRLIAPLPAPVGFPPSARSGRDVYAAIVKHTVPCGVAARATASDALAAALGADPISAFGGIVACSAPIDAGAAQLLKPRFLEVVAAPGISDQARELLRPKKDLRLLVFGQDFPASLGAAAKVRSALGGVLFEYPDPAVSPDRWQAVTDVEPSNEQWRDLLFAFGVVRQVKSNAAVVIKDEVTLGICGGQTNRLAAVELACHRAGDAVKGAVLATDGFFPFADGVEAAATAGIAAVVAPSGSIRDGEVVAAARRAGIALIFTQRRYFLH